MLVALVGWLLPGVGKVELAGHGSSAARRSSAAVSVADPLSCPQNVLTVAESDPIQGRRRPRSSRPPPRRRAARRAAAAPPCRCPAHRRGRTGRPTRIPSRQVVRSASMVALLMPASGLRATSDSTSQGTSTSTPTSSWAASGVWWLGWLGCPVPLQTFWQAGCEGMIGV